MGCMPAEDATPAIFVARGLTKIYRMGEVEVPALRSIDLQLYGGELVVLLGPSGSGKSTLLNILGGLDAPTSGEVYYLDHKLTGASEADLTRFRREHVGFVFQFYNLLPMLSAQKNVELPLLLTKLSAGERRKRAAIALQLVGLADRASHKPSELSGGQQQRVAIARAFVTDPTLLVCDEPTGDLDRASAEEVLGLLQRLNREHGKTIVMVTHDPRAAEHASHMVHLDKGELVGAARVAQPA